MEIEVKRKAVHFLGIFTIALIYIFGKLLASLIMLCISIGFIFAGEYRKNRKNYKKAKIIDEFEDVLEDEVKTYERRKELPFKGAITFFFGCFLAALLFEENIAIASIAVLALADSMSTLIGYFFGKHKLPINKKKSWEGSTAFFATSFFTLFFFVDPLKALIAAVIATFVEMLPQIDDNISVPLVTGLVLLLL